MFTWWRSSSMFRIDRYYEGFKDSYSYSWIGNHCIVWTFIVITGEKGNRILTPNTSILSHQYSWGSWGKEHELFAQVKEFELSTKRMIEHYKKCTGLTEKEIRTYLLPPEDVWLSAQEAKKLKICDAVKSVY